MSEAEFGDEDLFVAQIVPTVPLASLGGAGQQLTAHVQVARHQQVQSEHREVHVQQRLASRGHGRVVFGRVVSGEVRIGVRGERREGVQVVTVSERATEGG